VVATPKLLYRGAASVAPAPTFTQRTNPQPGSWQSVAFGNGTFVAIVNGEPAAILDVSTEGFRLELPRARRLPPPYFGVRIPLVGVAIIASRRWAISPSKDPSKIWCGAALSSNPSGAEEVWRSFVDTVPIVGSSGIRVNL